MEKTNNNIVMIIVLSIFILISGVFVFTNSNSNSNIENYVVNVVANIPTESLALDSSIFFSNRDYNTDAYNDNVVLIELNSNSISTSGIGVSVDGTIATITQEGTYVISGELNDGQIIVDLIDDTQKVQIMLDNASINSSTSAAINVVNADKVFITMISGSTNYITSNIKEENTVDAAIFSKSDLTFNGDGTLNIIATNGDGIVGKDELTFTSGTYNIIADEHALDSNDGIAIADGVFNITAAKDALHAEHSSNEEKGYIYILAGEFNLDVAQDGFDSSYFIEIISGEFNIVTNGGYENAPVKVAAANTTAPNRPGMTTTTTTTTTTTDSTSRKAIKANGEIRLYGGNFVIDAYDDAIHSDMRVEIIDGNYLINTADDAIHANWETIIRGGDIVIEFCFEGLEAQRIYVTGGSIDMYCNDDGINASSANADPNDSSISITITGGNITMDTNSEGDGIDSNGSILITGGNILISSTTDERDTALDSENDSIITGGIFVATGSNSMTLQNFNSGSSQASILVILPMVETSDVVLTDSNGNILLDYTPAKYYQAVTISMPELEVGQTYYLTTGSYTQEIKLTSLQYGTNTSSNSGPNSRR